jgi:hypothetical protein
VFFDLYHKLLALEPRNRGSLLSPTEVTGLIRKQIKDTDVRVITRRNKGVDLGTISIGGLYDSDSDNSSDPCIEIYIIYNPDQMHFSLENFNWGKVCFDVAEALGHETVHRQQHRRGFKTQNYFPSVARDHPDHDDQAYLGDTCEIEAYGYSIATELVCFHNSDIEKLEESNILMWVTYNHVFANDQSIVLQLRKQVIKYLNKLKAVQDVKTTNTRL